MHLHRTFAAIVAIATLLAASALAAIEVEGVADRTVYADAVTFKVVTEAGFNNSATLDDQPTPVGVPVLVNRPDYHELRVRRSPGAGGDEETAFIRFIVKASERGDTEWGLPPWTPYPIVNSAADEFAGAQLDVVLPPAMPAGLRVPMFVRVHEADGLTRRVNHLLATETLPPIQIRRGWGSVLAPEFSTAATHELHFAIPGATVARTLVIEDAPVWSEAGGTLSVPTTWTRNSRIHLTSHLEIDTGVRLTIEPGVVVKLAQGIEIRVGGGIRANGEAAAPIVFVPALAAEPWGGIVLRTNKASVVFNFTLLAGGGSDPDWFTHNKGSGTSHRGEQPVIHLQNGAKATLVDSAVIDSAGQASHGEKSTFTLTRSLLQRHTTGGQHNGGTVTAHDSAIIEFPGDGAAFADADNDAFYVTGGAHAFTNTLFGFSLDDCLDAGTGSAGTVDVVGCWFESSFHEGMAWSETRRPAVRDSVAFNCGQGIEAGFGTPKVMADHLLSLGNATGARFGDNYDRAHTGSLLVTNSLILHNYRDIFGLTWAKDAWTNELDQMDLHGNFLTRVDTNHPDNAVWNPAIDGARLLPFMGGAARGRVGVAFAPRPHTTDLTTPTNGVPVRLSIFSPSLVEVDYVIESPVRRRGEGTLRFEPGETVKRVPVGAELLDGAEVIHVTFTNPRQAELTGPSEMFFSNLPPGQIGAASFGGAVVLYWTGSDWTLEEANGLGGPWNPRGSTSPVVLAPSGQAFYRLTK